MNFKSLISDDLKNASIGRITMWLFTFVILYMMITEKNIDINVVYIYSMLIGYNLFKKPISIYKDIKELEIKNKFNKRDL